MDISIRSINNLTEYGNTSFYGGHQRASIKVVDSLQTSSGEPLNNETYTNAIMEIDSVMVQIKKYGEPDTKYQNIKGSHYQSKIVLGGRLDHSRYPENIDETAGTPSSVGIKPHAYNLNDDATDYYYFSDFYTRIKNTDQYGGALDLANSNSEARYPDGVYLIKPHAFKINNTEATNPANPNNNTPKQIIIDNFRPYISLVKIYEGPNWALKYERGWQWAGNALMLEPQPASAVLNQSQNIKVEIVSSEPMKEVSLKIGTLSIPTQSCGTDLNKTNWVFEVPIANSPNGLYTLEINGKDLANNQIQDKPAIIPIRQSNTLWSPSPTCGTSPPYLSDKYHSFIFGNNLIDFEANQLGLYDMTIQYKDKSTATGITAYSWNFGNTSNSSSSLKDPSFTYTSMGVYSVTHKINIGPSTQYSITKPVSVTNITAPNINNIWFTPKTTPGKSSSLFVDFFSDCEGIIGSYIWKLDGTLISNEANPIDVPINEFTLYAIELTVTNAAANAVLTKQIYIDPDNYPYASIQDWEVTYFVHDLEVSTANFKENEPLLFTIEYGDGITETYLENYYSYHTFTHNYYELGEYIVKVTVAGKDAQDKDIEVQTAKRIRVQPYDLDVSINYELLNTPAQPKEKIVCSATVIGGASGCIYSGSWGVYRIGDPNSYLATGFLSSQVPDFDFTPDIAGEYRVMLDVSVSGFPTSGHAGQSIEVENAPKYVDANISSDSYLLSLNSEFTLYGSVWPTGDPGVPEEDWNPTNIRWTLFDPQGNIDNVGGIKEEDFDFDEYMFTHYFTHLFNKSGTYKLLLETWNDQHSYLQNNELDTSNNCRLNFYNYIIKDIEVSANIPSINIVDPVYGSIEQLANAEVHDIIISNPSSTPINWNAEVLYIDESDWLHISITSGVALCCENQQPVTVAIDANSGEDNRYGLIKITGKDSNGNEIQGSPAWVQINQCGTAGPITWIVTGDITDHFFGQSVSVDGKTAVVGSPWTTLSGNGGRAYVYEKTDLGSWIRICTLKSSDNNPQFGKIVDISGDYVVVLGVNKTYFFKRDISGWTGEKTELKKYVTPEVFSASIWGDYAVIGAPLGVSSGKVEIYYRNEGGTDNWGLVKQLIGENGGDYFGTSVDLYNDRLVVGAPNGGQGYIKIFNRNLHSSNDWGTEQKIIAPAFEMYESGNSEFGKAASIFENTVSTTYYRYLDQGPGMWYGPALFSISYRDIINNGSWEEVGRDLVQDRPAGNNVTSATMFKSENQSGNEEYFSAGFGYPTQEYTLDNGTDGSFGSVLTSTGSIPGQDYISSYKNLQYLNYTKPDGGVYIPNQNEKFGMSVAYSYVANVVGITGYDTPVANNVGGALFENDVLLGNNLCEAGIDLQLINFSKPAGNYSDIIARNISLGGRAFPATIENGATITYIANEILLQDGFLADNGSIFSAEAQDCDSSDSDSPHKKSNQNINFEEWPLSMGTQKLLLKIYMRSFPDLPWQTFDLANNIDFSKVEDLNVNPITGNSQDYPMGNVTIQKNQDMTNIPVLLINDSKIKLKIGSGNKANK